MAEIDRDATPLVEAPENTITTTKVEKTGEDKKKKEKSTDRKVRKIKSTKPLLRIR